MTNERNVSSFYDQSCVCYLLFGGSIQESNHHLPSRISWSLSCGLLNRLILPALLGWIMLSLVTSESSTIYTESLAVPLALKLSTSLSSNGFSPYTLLDSNTVHMSVWEGQINKSLECSFKTCCYLLSHMGSKAMHLPCLQCFSNYFNI